jgi:predicted amidohydrolase
MPRIAAVQFAPQFKEHPSNLRRMVSLVVRAANAGAKLIVFPELATTGYSFMSKEDAEPYAEVLTEFDPAKVLRVMEQPRPPGKATTPSMDLMYVLALKHKTHVVWGLVEKDAGTGDLYNSQVLMCPDGKYESMRKINRWGNDFLWARPGRANPPIMTCDLGERTRKVGLLICRDVRDKKDSHWNSFYQRGDADIVCLSANWGDGGFPATTWMEFVEDNLATLIVANRYGQEGPNDFGEGGTCIIHPPDKVLCEGLTWNEDCVIYDDL